jgi:hypothetical protein
LVPDFAEATAFFAGPVRRIERKQARIEFFEGAPATRTTHLRAHDRESTFRIDEAGGAATNLERALAEIARLGDALLVDHTDNHINGVFLETLKLTKLPHRNELPVDEKGVESIALGPTRDIGVKPLSRFYQRCQHLERTTASRCLHLFHDCSQSLFFDRQIAIGTELRAGFCKEQP